MNRVAIVDYHMGNLDSVARAVEECGGEPLVTNRPEDFASANRIILPGVGSFTDGIRNLRKAGLDEVLREQVVEQQVPFLGICLGMQLLATTGSEGGEEAGLGWIEGDVCRLEPIEPGTRIPHVGWNEIVPQAGSPLFADVPEAANFYFVHSYHLRCRNPENVLATTDYCGGFVSAVSRGNLYGVQFHPEKSQRIGFCVLRNFLAM